MMAATEARQIGRGGVSIVSRACGLSRVTIAKGIRELDRPPLEPGRVRRAGGGRWRLEKADPDLPDALEHLVEPLARGDPESPLRWTSKSTRALAAELRAQKHPLSHEKVAGLLRDMGYSLQSNRKTEEGSDHPDRDAQFRHINEQVRNALARGWPVVSVDTKKKELIGNYVNAGRQWRRAKQPLVVNSYDFPKPSVPRAYPYGIYDLGRNTGFVNVGTDHDTGAFAVASIRGWWRAEGAAVPQDSQASDHRRWRREQRLSSSAVEAGATAPCRRDRSDDHRVPLPSGHKQVEQGRAPLVLVHLVELARRTAA